ncbi:MAG: tetratricopeptide repeat protein [Bacteroidetes bacterium]|nr:tetratricopeptide repeat protein [Bacteroidota bacterium]
MLALLVFSSVLAQKDSENLNRFLAFKEKAVYYRTSNLDSGRIFIDSCVNIALEMKDLFYLGDALQLKSHNFFMRSQADSALVYGKKACEIFQYYPDSTEHYVAEYNVGNIYLYLEEYIQALVQFKKVLRIIDENFEIYVRTNKHSLDLNRAYCYASIAQVYEYLGDYNAKLQNAQKALKIAQKVPGHESEVLQAITLGNIGLAYYQLGHFEKAESYAIAGMEQKKRLGIESSLGYNYAVLAKAAFGRKKYTLALKYLELSDKSFRQINSQTELNRNELLRAKCFYKSGRDEKALEILQRVERQFDGPGTKYERIELYELMGEIYESHNDFESANKYLRIVILLKDELTRKNSRDATDQFLTFFEDEENRIDDKLSNYKNLKEKEKLEMEVKVEKEKQVWIYSLFIVSILCLILIIIVIARGNRRSKRINQELSYSIDEKQILFKEVHHRVKNNFQIISSLLNLQQGIEEDRRSKKVLTDAQGRIQSMSLVHEMLYRKNEVKRIDFRTYTEELVSSIIKSFSNNITHIEYSIQCSDESFDLELAVPLGLILNEAVTNSVKYAFDENPNGKIEILLKPIDSKNYQLTICDNGKGIPEEFINGSKETLGIELINILSEQLGGSARFLNENGTEVRVIFDAVD